LQILLLAQHVEQAIRSAIKTSVASSWHFISTYSPDVYASSLAACYKDSFDTW